MKSMIRSVLMESLIVQANTKPQQKVLIEKFDWGVQISKCSKQLAVVETLFHCIAYVCFFICLMMATAFMITAALFDGFSGSVKAELREILAFLTILFSGLVFRHFGRRGFRRQLEIDEANREIRTGYRSDGRCFSMKHGFAFSNVERAYIDKASSTNRLSIKLKGTSAPINVISADDRSLLLIVDRLNRHITECRKPFLLKERFQVAA